MATYPTFTAGQRLTAALLTSMLPVWIYKTAQTDRTSTATVADDPDLQYTMAASATYSVQIWLHYSTPAAADFRSDWNYTGTAGTNKAGLGLGTSVSESTPQGIMRSGVHGFATDIVYGDRGGSNQIFAYESGVVTTTTSGLFTFRWAQGTSTGTATSLHADSRMCIQRMA